MSDETEEIEEKAGFGVHVTPAPGFDIRVVAERLAGVCEDMDQPLIIHFLEFEAEFEPGCTAEEIIAGYQQVLKMQMESARPSNTNEPGED